MSEVNPLLIFPQPTAVAKQARQRFIPSMQYPSADRQVERITPKFEQLEKAFENRRVTVQRDMTGAAPEKALVFEIAGTVDNFFNAVKKIDDLEWLAEWEEKVSSDDDFFDAKDPNKDISARLYLIMTNQKALTDLKSLWSQYKNREKLPFGLTKWRDLFGKLKDIRTWGIRDRLESTGVLDYWRERLELGQETVRFEVELWYRSNSPKRLEASQDIRRLVEEAGGRVIYQAIIDEISYHAILVETPITIFDNLSEESSVKLIKSENIMYIRPVGQAMVGTPDDVPITDFRPVGDVHLESTDPVVGILDGMPLANHQLLAGRLVIDDPDNYGQSYQASERKHGTSMSSLVVHGELDEHPSIPLNHPVYVRPIMKPIKWGDDSFEQIPEDVLAIDLVHQAVKRIFDGENGGPPVAPTIKVINLSMGDLSRPFDTTMSPWAKMLDYLSYKYNVLFVVSAGNFSEGIIVDVEKEKYRELSANEKRDNSIRAISNNLTNRRIISPSESVNALTVGAAHVDSSTIVQIGRRVDIQEDFVSSSPISRVGLGYGRSVKPDILMPGGRQLYLEHLMGVDGKAFLIPSISLRNAPGQRVAFPAGEGQLSATAFTCGTSNSTALASRLAAKIYDNLIGLRATVEGGDLILDRNITSLIKALIVHGASWGGADSVLESILKTPENSRKFREHISRFLGYGLVDANKVLQSTNNRATVLGCGVLTKDQAHLFKLPLPPSLSGQTVWRRLTITLAWLTPVNANNQKYRQAHLWFVPPNEELILSRSEGDHNAVQRGTVQHEILEGRRAAAFVDGDTLNIQVNCRDYAGQLNHQIPYGLVVSLETADGLNIPIYDEIRSRIRQAISVHP